MNPPPEYPQLFPHHTHSGQNGLFEELMGRTEAGQASTAMPLHDAPDEEQEMIDEQLLKKTSELHEALRNIKLLRFQLIESKIMKKNNLAKSSQLGQKIADLEEKKAVLKTENEELENEMELYTQKIKLSRSSNGALYEKLRVLSERLAQSKIQHRTIITNSSLATTLHDKENMSEVANNRYISLEKLTLQAENRGAQEMIALIKQEIISAKAKLGEAQAKKESLQAQYQHLLSSLKMAQSTQMPTKNNESTYRQINKSSAIIHSEEIYEIANKNSEIVPTKKNHQNKSKEWLQANAKDGKYTNTQNKSKPSSKKGASNASTNKKSKIL